MRENIKLYLTAFNTALQAKFEYRVDFFVGVLTSCMLQLSSLFFLWIVFHQTPSINGWMPDQVILLFGMTAAALGLSELFFNHIWFVPAYIVQGDLDRLLTYPVNSLYFLLITRPELHAFGNLATGTLLTSYALIHLNAPWYAWVLFPLFAVSGCLIYTAALVIAASLSFKFVGPTSINLFITNILLNAFSVGSLRSLPLPACQFAFRKKPESLDHIGHAFGGFVFLLGSGLVLALGS
jgi:ABC-2 type transport system permease protein